MKEKEKKPALKGPKDRIVEWTDDPGPSIAYIRTDLPPLNLRTNDPVLERAAAKRRKPRHDGPASREPA